MSNRNSFNDTKNFLDSITMEELYGDNNEHMIRQFFWALKHNENAVGVSVDDTSINILRNSSRLYKPTESYENITVWQNEQAYLKCDPDRVKHLIFFIVIPLDDPSVKRLMLMYQMESM